MHFGLFPNTFVYFHLANFHHRDLEHGSVFDLPLPALCGTRSSVSSRTSVTEIKVLDQSVRGCSEMLYGMRCACMSFWWCPWLLRTQLCDLGKSFQPQRRHTAIYVQEKNMHYSQLNSEFVQIILGVKSTGRMEYSQPYARQPSFLIRG